MKTIKLTQGQVALVDDADFEWLNQWKWQAQKGAITYYPVRTDYSNGRRNKVLIYMHILILGITDKDLEGDHIDRNGLNNQRSNLRIATRSQNNANKRPALNSTSKYKGVGWHKATSKWAAYIRKDDKQYHLGVYNNEVEAAMVYNKKATELHGEFASLNKL